MNVEIVFWHWWAFGALLLVVELLVPGMFFLWMAEAAVVTGGILWVFSALSFDYQLVLFSVLSVVSIGVARRVLKTHPIVSDKPGLNRRTAQYVGRVFTLEKAIVNGEGRIRINDGFWKVRGEDSPAGTRVKVVSCDGVELWVVPVGSD